MGDPGGDEVCLGFVQDKSGFVITSQGLFGFFSFSCRYSQKSKLLIDLELRHDVFESFSRRRKLPLNRRKS